MAEPGVKTFLEMQQQVSKRLLNKSIATSSDFPTLTDIKGELNDQMRRFIAKRNWRWRVRTDTSVTLATDTTDYSMSDNAQLVMRIRNLTTGNNYTFQERGDFERQNKKAASSFSSGEPTRWTYIDPDSDNSLKIRFNTKPPSGNNGDTLDITYLLRHVNLSNDADVSVLPVEFQEIPIYRTISEFFTMLDDHTNAAMWGAKAERLEGNAWKQHINQSDYVHTPKMVGFSVSSNWPYN